MSSNKNKHLDNKKGDSVQEPIMFYGTEDGFVSNDSEKANPILEKLISKSIQDSKDGKGISNEEMNQKIKSKYPFLK